VTDENDRAIDRGRVAHDRIRIEGKSPQGVPRRADVDALSSQSFDDARES
jgi:hypothetical protein